MTWLKLLYAVILPNIGGIANAFSIKKHVREWYDKVGMSLYDVLLKTQFSLRKRLNIETITEYTADVMLTH